MIETKNTGGRVSNKFRIMIKENPDNPKTFLVLQEGLSENDAAEILMMYEADGKTDLVLEEYYPEADRMGRNPELH